MLVIIGVHFMFTAHIKHSQLLPKSNIPCLIQSITSKGPIHTKQRCVRENLTEV